MRHLDKIGFTLCLIGTAGIAEAYGFNRSLSISLVLIIIGCLMVAAGEVRNDAEKAKRSDNGHHSGNVLDRLYFLR